MQDRLGDLKKSQRAGPEILETETDELMPDFSKKMGELQACIKKVKEDNQEINRLKSELKKTISSEQEKTIRERLFKINNDNTLTCQRIKSDLEILENEVERAKKHEKDEPETRIKEINYKAFKAKFAEVLKEIQNSQVEVKTAIRNDMIRKVKNVDPTLDDEKVETIINDPEGYTKTQEAKLLGVGAHIRLKNAVADISDKLKDIQKLERNIEIIHQMFIDMEMLVQAQGDALDNIELNVQITENYMKKANKELKEAKASHQNAKKWKCICLLILVGVIAVAVIVPVVLTR